MPVIVDIANAVVSDLNGATLSITPTSVELKYEGASGVDITASQGLRLYVVPLGQTINPETRGDHEFVYTVAIGILKKVTAGVDAEVVECLTVVEEIVDLFRGAGSLTTYADASLVEVTNDPGYQPDRLRELSVFGSVVTLKYKLLR